MPPPFSMPLADLLPYLSEDARLLEAGTIGRVEGASSEVQTGTLPKTETNTPPLRTGEEVTSGDSNGGIVDALEKGDVAHSLPSSPEKAATMEPPPLPDKTVEAGKVAEGNVSASAARLGVDVSEISVFEGVAKTRIGVSDKITYADINQLIEYAHKKGATRVEVETGYIANPKLLDLLERMAQSGRTFMRGKVVKIYDKTTDFLIIYELKK